jgi:hypothetical protein
MKFCRTTSSYAGGTLEVRCAPEVILAPLRLELLFPGSVEPVKFVNDAILIKVGISNWRGLKLSIS